MKSSMQQLKRDNNTERSVIPWQGVFLDTKKLKTIDVKTKKLTKGSRECFEYENYFRAYKKLVIKVPKSKLNDYKKLWKGHIPTTVKIKAGN